MSTEYIDNNNLAYNVGNKNSTDSQSKQKNKNRNMKAFYETVGNTASVQKWSNWKVGLKHSYESLYNCDKFQVAFYNFKNY